MNIERGFITKLLETKEYIEVEDAQIKSDFFVLQEDRKAFKFIQKYYSKHGTVPTVRVFERSFPDYELESTEAENGVEVIGTEEPLSYWCEQLRVKKKHNTLVSATEKIAESLDAGNTEDAYAEWLKTVMVVENQINETTAVDITQDTDKRKQLYLMRKENQGMLGIPMGIDRLDYVLKGMQKANLISMIASTGIGKTWFEVLIGSYAMLNGYRVFQGVTEMSEEQMRDRYEAVLYGMMIGEFDYERFKSGTLPQPVEKKYFQFLDKHLPKLEPLIIETVTSVSSLSAKIDQHKPDLVLIDSAYLMEDDEKAEADWLRVAHITRGLKMLCKNKKIPFFLNSQADATTSKRTGPELENIGYSKAIGQDSDVVMALFQDQQMREDKEMKVKVLKQREGRLGNVLLNWDFNTMNFDPIYADFDGDTEGAGDSSGEDTTTNSRVIEID